MHGNESKKKTKKNPPGSTRALANDIAKEMSEQQLTECKEAFKMFDKDRSGAISRTELADVMRILGNNPTDTEINNLMSELDKNENGLIEFDEFLVLMSAHLKDPEDEARELRDAFQIFDRDGNNFIDAEEIRFVMKNIGEKLTDEQIDKIFSMADVNQDGKLDYDEFINLMTAKKN